MERELPDRVKAIIAARRQRTQFSDDFKTKLEETIMVALAEAGLSEGAFQALTFEYRDTAKEGVTVHLKGQNNADKDIFDKYAAKLEGVSREGKVFSAQRSGGHCMNVTDIYFILTANTVNDLASSMGITLEPQRPNLKVVDNSPSEPGGRS